MSTTRAFIAFELPRDVVNAIVTSRARVERLVPPTRWVRPDHLHLTLLFLGEVPAAVLKALSRALAGQLDGIPAPRIALRGAGFFPNARRARVAWIGGEAEKVEEVRAGINRAANEVGLTGETQPWSLHLTQGRMKRPWPSRAIREFGKWGESLVLDPFDAKDVVVFTSELHPAGPVYTAFERIQLS